MVPHRSPTSTYRWVCLGVLFLSGFLAFLTRLAPAVALPNLQITFGLTAAELSLLTALYLWPFALMQPVAGLFTDRLGPRRSVTIFLVIAGCGQLLLALAPSFASALLGRAATGIGGSILYVAAAKIMAQWFRRREFGTLTGAWTSVANLGGIAAAAPLAAQPLQLQPPKPAATGATRFAWLEAVRLLGIPFILVLWIVTFIDSTGLRLLMRASTLVEGRMWVRGASRHISRVLELSGVSRFFCMEEDPVIAHRMISKRRAGQAANA